MSSDNRSTLVATGALIGVSALCGAAVASVRALMYLVQRRRWIKGLTIYKSDVDEDVMTRPLFTEFMRFTMPTSTPNSLFTVGQDSNSLTPAFSVSFSVEAFEHSLKLLSMSAKWPRDYFTSEASRSEAERLALYLMGIADAYISEGPNAVPSTPSLQLSLSTLYFCAANLGLQEAFDVTIARPRTSYGLLSYAEKDECKAARIVDQALKHAMKNSVITFYELIILFLLQVGEYDGSLALLQQLRPTNYTRLFGAYALLASEDYEAYVKMLRNMSALLNNHPKLHNLLQQLEGITSVEDFPLPTLAASLFEPFMGNEQS